MTAKISLICMLTHPSMDPAIITNKLELKPTLVQKSGEQVVTPKGKKVNSKYQVSKWQYKLSEVSDDHLSRNFDTIIKHLSKYKEFLEKLVTEGGTCQVYISFSGISGLAFELDKELMAMMVGMNITFGFESFE